MSTRLRSWIVLLTFNFWSRNNLAGPHRVLVVCAG
jgi:hypothetical protein